MQNIFPGLFNMFQDDWWNFKWCIKIQPQSKINDNAKEEQSVQNTKHDSLSITDNSTGNCKSEEKCEEYVPERAPISFSMYGGVRDSMRSEYVAVASRSPSTDNSHSCLDAEQYFGGAEVDDIPEIIRTDTDDPKIPGDAKYKNILTCSWPSIAGQVSVHSPSTGSTQTEGSEPTIITSKRLSTNCDSGYSELDIRSVGRERKDCSTVEEEKEFSNDAKYLKPSSFESVFLPQIQRSIPRDYSDISLASSVKPVLHDLELCYNLEKIVETTEEDKYLEEVENISICSENSSSSGRPARTSGPSRQCGLAQYSSVEIYRNMQQHNVSQKYAETMKQDKLTLPFSNRGDYSL